MERIENIVFFGTGAAGSNVFQHCLYAYPALNFTIVDDDKVEGRNVDPGTQPYEKSDLNRPKTQAMQRIAMKLKNKKVVGVNQRINTVDEIRMYAPDMAHTLLIDSFDNAPSRNLFTQLPIGYNVIHVGFSGSLTGEAVWDGVFTPMNESKSDKDIDVCEMAMARPFIFSLCACASLAIARFIESGEKTNLYFDSHFILRSW